MRYPSYEQFIRANKMRKGRVSCRLSNVRGLSSATGAVCDMTVIDNTTTVTVKSLVEDIYFNDMGVTSNPSLIKNWAGWGRDLAGF